MVRSHLKLSTNPPRCRHPLHPPPTPTHMVNYSNYSCAPQSLTKDLLRCRYGVWWWHLVWRLHNYWCTPPPLKCRCECFQMGLSWVARICESDNNALPSCLSKWKCWDISVPCITPCYKDLFQAMIHLLIQLWKELFVLLLLLQWAVDTTRCRDYRNEEDIHKICMSGPLRCVQSPEGVILLIVS